MATICRLGGIALSAVETIAWSLRQGVDPYERVFTVHRSEADQLKEFLGKDVTLTIRSDTAPELVVKGLTILTIEPTSDPIFGSVLVADRRWKWRRRHVTRRYNVPQRTGERRFVGGAPQAVSPSVPLLRYKEWSLKDGRNRWTTQEVLEDVLTEIEGDNWRAIEIPTFTVPVENLEIDDPGDRALARVLDLFAGAAVHVDREGVVVVTDALRESYASSVVALAGPEIVEGRHPELVRFHAVRPARVFCYFTREQEIRFDSVMESASVTVTKDERFMENVLPVPDAELTLPDTGETVHMGTWLPIRRVLPAWNESLGTRAGGQAMNPISFDEIREGWIGDVLVNKYSALGVLTIDAVWPARIAALKSHYRQTYRINKRWTDRTRTIRAYRVSILDPATGTRAPAQAFADYCVKASTKRLHPENGRAFLWMNVLGYAVDVDADDAHPSPVVVVVEDEDQGIIRLNYVTDLAQALAEVIPSFVDGVPTAELTDEKNPWTANDLVVKGQLLSQRPKLSSGHRVAVVLTATAGAPNGLGQFHVRAITPEDVGVNFWGATTSPSGGPPWHLRIGPGVTTARFAWRDADAERIARSFGVGVPIDKLDDPEDLTDLLVNAREVEEVAIAASATVYRMLSDRWEGDLTVHLNPRIEPGGSVHEVQHALRADGALLTTILLRPLPRQVDLFSFLPADIRQVLMRLVVPA